MMIGSASMWIAGIALVAVLVAGGAMCVHALGVINCYSPDEFVAIGRSRALTKFGVLILPWGPFAIVTAAHFFLVVRPRLDRQRGAAVPDRG